MNIKIIDSSPGAHHRDFEFSVDEKMSTIKVEVTDSYLPLNVPLTHDVARDIAGHVRKSPDTLEGYTVFQAVIEDDGQYPAEPGIAALR